MNHLTSLSSMQAAKPIETQVLICPRTQICLAHKKSCMNATYLQINSHRTDDFYRLRPIRLSGAVNFQDLLPST